MGSRRQSVADGLLLLACGIGLWRGWQELRRERDGWASVGRLRLRFEGGALFLHEGAVLRESRALESVVAIDAIVSRRRVERILVDDRDGARTVFAGLQDMGAFLADLRVQAPSARYRLMTMGFPMRLKEVTA